MLREAGLNTPENGSDLSDIDDSDCVYDERLSKPLKEDNDNFNDGSPIMTSRHLKEVFEEYGTHLAGMPELSDSE
jgi:hypothetical protein